MDLYCKGLLVYFTINEGKKATIKDHLRGGHFNFRKYYQNFFFLFAGLCTIRLCIFIMNFILSLKEHFQQQTSIVIFINTIFCR